MCVSRFPSLANLGIDPNSIQQVLQTQNLLVNTGEIMTGTYQLRVRAEGTYKSIEDIRDQLIVTKGGGEVRWVISQPSNEAIWTRLPT